MSIYTFPTNDQGVSIEGTQNGPYEQIPNGYTANIVTSSSIASAVTLDTASRAGWARWVYTGGPVSGTAWIDLYYTVTGSFAPTGKPNAIYLTSPKYGAHLDGTNDDAALAAACADVPSGGVLVLPAALIGFSTWTPPVGINILGGGWWNVTNSPFGSSNWNPSNYGPPGPDPLTAGFSGTVMLSTATAGTAVTLADPNQDTGGGSFKGVMILGPGSGTSTGLAIGGANYNAPYEVDVLVANFNNGAQLTKVEDSTLSIRIRGCGATGFKDDGSTNNNTYLNLEVQTSVNGAVVTGAGNKFVAPLIQNCTGQALLVSGNGNTLDTLWSENSASTTANSITGNQNTIINPRAGYTNDVVGLAGSSNLFLSSVSDGPSAIPVGGNNNVLVGTFSFAPTVTGTGNVVLASNQPLSVAEIKGIAGLLKIGAPTDGADITLQIGDGQDTNIKILRGSGVDYINLLAAAGGASGLNNQFLIDFGGTTRDFILDDYNGVTRTNFFRLSRIGRHPSFSEAANAAQGVAVLVGGTVTVANTSVTANSRILLTSQVPGGTPGSLGVSARTAGTSFTITSSSALDTSTVAYLLMEPA
jgi:hypothetical protein